ncbi:hypothetical protein GCM10009092_15050 [Bowmanella denitrificans]|uniref:MotA/TolQ/ExbB proton channel domain-containing protein n=1 Tax=Bowmanella denitrificans TaxID=366582 RepID=A0ABN0X014_9ALTE
MDNRAPREFIYQLFSLLMAIILVHGLYVSLIRPRADALIQQQIELQSQGQTIQAQRSWYVVLKDFEQESCFILMLWACSIMAFKAMQLQKERRMLDRHWLPTEQGTTILPTDAVDLSRPLQSLPEQQQQLLVPRTLLTALQRFGATGDVAASAEAIKEQCDTESDRLDSELSLVRYIAWAIPSIGFIGTVRGIGDALGQAHKAIEGDITGVTQALGVAFNSTFIALLISIFIMFVSHQLQLQQERVVTQTKRYTDEHLLRWMKQVE